MKKIFHGILFVMMCTHAYGGGYRVALQGARQTAMGHTGVGIVMDASNVFFNPAGLSFLKSKWSVSAGVTLLWATAHYQDTRTYAQYKTQSPMGTPLSLYAAYKVNDRLSLGLGLYTPFGSAIKWPQGWEGRILVASIDMKVFFFQPTFSYKVNDWLSLGGGLILSRGSIDLKRYGPLKESAQVRLHDGSASGFGYRLSAMARPLPHWTFGLDYRSEIDLEVKGGDVTLNGFPKSLIGAQGSPILDDHDHFDATLPLPAELSAGASFQATRALLLALDVNYTFWKAYRNLVVQFHKNKMGFTEDGQPTTLYRSPRNYKDVLTYRFGAQYDFTPRLTGRLGYYYDPSPSPAAYWSPETPTTDDNSLTAGFSYVLNDHLTFDLAYLYVNGKERSVKNEHDKFFGRVYARAHALSLGITCNF